MVLLRPAPTAPDTTANVVSTAVYASVNKFAQIGFKFPEQGALVVNKIFVMFHLFYAL